MSIVKVTLTHSASRTIVPEKRYGLAQTISSIKDNAASHFATPSNYMRLELRDASGITISSNMEDDQVLGFYQCKDGYEIHIIDTQPAAKIENFEDLSQVEKYEISEEAYAKREDNVRAFKQRMLAEQREQLQAMGVDPDEGKKILTDDSYQEQASTMNVGDRCQCRPGDRLGTVRYVGRVPGLKIGFWIGVEFDEPVGKSDGTVKGKRFFDCRPLYGGFLRPDQVEVGDFPPEEF